MKRVDEDDLFPGEIYIPENCDQEEKIIYLNERKTDQKFVKRVLMRFEEGRKIFLQDLLLKLITTLKENGVENDKDEMILNEINLKKLLVASGEEYKSVVEYGIEKIVYEKKQRRGN